METSSKKNLHERFLFLLGKTVIDTNSKTNFYQEHTSDTIQQCTEAPKNN